jgi:hypothetical protein
VENTAVTRPSKSKLAEPNIKMHIFLALLSLLALASIGETYGKSKNPKDAILLSNVKSLTLRADKKTSHRRVSAIPQ